MSKADTTPSSSFLTPYKPLKIAPKAHIQDIVKTLILTRDQRSKSEIEDVLDGGDMAFSRPVQLMKSLSDDRTTVAIYSFVGEIVIAFHLDINTDDFIELTSSDPIRFVDGLGVPGRVHDGVVREWRPISEQVLRQVQLFVRDNPSGVVTMAGYRAGGAIASLNAIYTQKQLFLGDRLRLMTFGGVRFVNGKMRKAVRTLLNGNAFDVIVDADPIYARKRYATLGTTYFRVGQLIHLRSHRAYDRYWTRWQRQIEIEAWDGNVVRMSKQK